MTRLESLRLARQASEEEAPRVRLSRGHAQWTQRAESPTLRCVRSFVSTNGPEAHRRHSQAWMIQRLKGSGPVNCPVLRRNSPVMRTVLPTAGLFFIVVSLLSAGLPSSK
jgi:hypothetical protein